MKITTVLFDLDGTLLPLDQDRFIEEYFNLVSRYVIQREADAKKYLNAVKKAIFTMMANDGQMLNIELFGKVYSRELGEGKGYEQLFSDFYEKDFGELRAVCGFAPQAKRIVELLKAAGLTLVLATNPAFPMEATHQRIRWAGLEPSDFLLVTSYENSSFCKPCPRYYGEVLEKLAAAPRECVMIGNDTLDDMAAEELGIKTFLLTNDLVNRTGRDVSLYANGGWAELEEWLRANVL